MNNKLIAIVGPTSSNKTNLSLKINEQFKFPLINADAFQVYREISSGTNKLSSDIVEKAPVYLMNNISIYDEWNISIFKQKAEEIIKNIHASNAIPILVGGSNLYVEALIKNYDLKPICKINESDYDKYSNDQLFDTLYKIDPDDAKKITKHNRRRLIRAIHIYNETKIIKSNNLSSTFSYDVLFIYCHLDRNVLYDQINKKVVEMINSGWQDEIKNLLKKDNNVMKLNALKAIGYHEVYDSIINNTSIDVDEISKKTRHYAKRQMTWIKNRYKNLIVYDQNNLDEIIKHVENFRDKN